MDKKRGGGKRGRWEERERQRNSELEGVKKQVETLTLPGRVDRMRRDRV